MNLRPLIERKRQELRVNGRAYFGPVATADFLRVRLPRSTLAFQHNKRLMAYFASKTGFAHTAYTMEMLESGRGKSCGNGVILQLRLTLSTTQDLYDIPRLRARTFAYRAEGHSTSARPQHVQGVVRKS